MGYLKYCMIVSNVLVWVAGLIALVVGIWAVADKQFADRFCGKATDSTSMKLCEVAAYIKPAGVLLIIAGAVVLILGFLGCIGAMRESKCLLGIYTVLLSLFLILLIAAGIFGFVKKNSVVGDVTSVASVQFGWEISQYTNAFNGVNSSTAELNLVVLGAIQSWLQCCGQNGTTDYKCNTQCIPSSCYPDLNLKSTAYSGGCVNSLDALLRKVFITVGIIGLVMAALLLIGIICSLVLCRSFNYQTV